MQVAYGQWWVSFLFPFCRRLQSACSPHQHASEFYKYTKNKSKHAVLDNLFEAFCFSSPASVMHFIHKSNENALKKNELLFF